MTFSFDMAIRISFEKFLFNSFAEVLGSRTMENNDVLSANSFIVDVMSTCQLIDH